ncbi:phage holin family protein [Patescibacteria group bacterium]|nr:phage holin family protein [Patescibacteria group bacterium]
MDWARLAYGFAANLVGIFLASSLGLLHYNGFVSLLIAAVVFGIVNVLIRPVVTVLSLPAIIMTFGLFIFVVNALMLWLTSIVVPSFDVISFWHTIGAAVIIGIVNFGMHALAGDVNRDQLTKAKEVHKQR